MPLSTIENKILAILFACGDPIEPDRIAEALETDNDTIEKLALRIDDYLEENGLPLQILRLENKYQLCTRSEYTQVIKNALEIKRNVPLSQAALEVLAIVAYNQPVTKSFVEQVRGVDSSGVVSSLVEKGLIEEAGRLELPGRPISYKTTPVFLRCFGLSSIEQLPTVAIGSEENEETENYEEEPDQIGFDQSMEQ